MVPARSGGLRRARCAAAAIVGSLIIVTAGWPAGEIFIDFEDENFGQWVVVDEPPKNLGNQDSSTWEITDTHLGGGGNVLEGKVLTQGEGLIFGDAADHMLMGTIIYFAQQPFTNFRFEVDVITSDNNGMGPVWGYADLDQHYRIQMMNNRWPEVPPIDGHHGPMVIAHKRISNETPWYELLEVIDDPAEYIPYPVLSEMHWTLEVQAGSFAFTSKDLASGDEMTLRGYDDGYSTGYVGFQLYAQTAEFDNFWIKPLAADNDLQPGDADQDWDFDQLDLVQVQVTAKYLTGQPATWGEGDWDGAPGGEPGNPPTGDGIFDQLDIITALQPVHYLTGPYAAILPQGEQNDEQTSVAHDATTGELAMDTPAGTELTSTNIDLASAISTGDVAQAGLFGASVADELTVAGWLQRDGDQSRVDLTYIPEPSTFVLLGLALTGIGLMRLRRQDSLNRRPNRRFLEPHRHSSCARPSLDSEDERRLVVPPWSIRCG